MSAWEKFRFALRGLIALALAEAPELHAVIFYSTGDVNHNTTAPTGPLSNSGWHLVGQWGGYQGVPIGPNHFITARHVGGNLGEALVLDGVSYPTTAFADDAGSDLRIWQVTGTFPAWAPLYRTSDEIGKPLVVFGRGSTRGTDLQVESVLKGWLWGSYDGQLRWGQNAVSSTLDGGSYWGPLLYATFDATGGPNEAHLAVGDSSGPVFIHNGTEWALAGVAAAVDAYFNTTNSGPGFNAAIFDGRGLYYSSNPPATPWQLISGPTPVPSGFYATRISARVAWIDSIVPPTLNVPLLDPVRSAMLAAGLFVTGAVYFKRRRSLRPRHG
jgi:hypothetical protein